MRDLRAFFAEYERAFNAYDARAALAMYGEWALAGNPFGSTCARNDATLRAALEQGYAFYRELNERNNIQATRIIDVSQQAIDEHFTLAKVDWGLIHRDGHTVLTFSESFIVQMIGGFPKIVAFFVPDEQKLLNEKGLL